MKLVVFCLFIFIAAIAAQTTPTTPAPATQPPAQQPPPAGGIANPDFTHLIEVFLKVIVNAVNLIFPVNGLQISNSSNYASASALQSAVQAAQKAGQNILVLPL